MQHFMQQILHGAAKVDFVGWPNDTSFQMQHLVSVTKKNQVMNRISMIPMCSFTSLVHHTCYAHSYFYQMLQDPAK